MIVSDVADEACRLVAAAEAEGMTIRVLGGVGVYMRCPQLAGREDLAREYQDIDVAGHRRDARSIAALLRGEGYEPHERFNALQASVRQLFFDVPNARQLDVFLDTFEMCHKLDLRPRLGFDGPALAASDLLLMKLQVVELNEKDVTDAVTLLLAHPPIAGDVQDGISLDRVREICGRDWGWYTTLHDNLETVRSRAPARLADAREAQSVAGRVGQILAAIETAEKTRRWQLRARIGRRVAWYDLPEEVARSAPAFSSGPERSP